AGGCAGCDDSAADRAPRPRTEAEQRLVETHDEARPVLVEDGLEERPPNGVGRDRACRLAGGKGTKLREQRRALPARLAEEYRAPQRRRRQSVAAPEQRCERLPELLRAERVGLEERELPAVERLAEIRIAVDAGQPRQQLPGERRPHRVQANRLARGARRRDRQDGPDPVRAPVEPLEQDRTRSDRAGGRQA